MKTKLLLILILGVFCQLNAQNAYTDSLTMRLNQPEIAQSEKMKIYGLLVEQLRSEEQYDKATSINNKRIQWAKNEKNYFELTKAYVAQGIIYNNQDEFEKARMSLDKALIFSAKAKNKLAVAYTDYLNAYILENFGESEAAIKLFQKVLTTAENTDEEFLKARTYYKLYGIYTDWNDAENSLLYAGKAVESAKKSGDLNLLANTYTALAVAYTYLYDNQKKKLDLDKVFELSEKAVALCNQNSGNISNRTLAIAELNLASYYLKYYPKNTQLVKDNTLKALSTAQKTKGNERIVANAYGILGELAKSENNTLQSMNYLNIAYSVLLTEKKLDYKTLILICEALAEWHEQSKNFSEAFRYQKLATDYTKQLFDESQATTAKRLQAQFQFEKKEQEVKTLKEKAESQRYQKILYAGLGIAGFLGAFFMFRSYHFRLRYSIERGKKLATEKKETEMQIKLEKEEQTKLKLEQELLTLQQEKLQKEVMVNQLHIQHKNEVLQQLKDKLGDEKSLNIQQIIREENLLDNDFEKAKFQIQEIHPNFFKMLNEKTQQKLTELDLKYCAYLHLGMDTKQIANLLNVEPKSVRMTKYRLKQKLGLGAEIDLVEYLKGLV